MLADNEFRHHGPPEPSDVAAVRSLSADCTALLGTYGQQGSVGQFSQHPDTGCTSPLEHVIYLSDLLHATKARIERLVSDARPVHVTVPRCDLVAGYHRWSPNDLVASVTSDSESLVRLAVDVAVNEQLSEEVSGGLAAIISPLLHELLSRRAKPSPPSAARPGRRMLIPWPTKPARSAVVAADLRPGDRVLRHDDGVLDFEVAASAHDQGRVQLIDTDGAAHNYHGADIVAVERS